MHYGVIDSALNDRGFAYFYFRDDDATAAMVETTPGEFREPQGSDNSSFLATSPTPNAPSLGSKLGPGKCFGWRPVPVLFNAKTLGQPSASWDHLQYIQASANETLKPPLLAADFDSGFSELVSKRHSTTCHDKQAYHIHDRAAFFLYDEWFSSSGCRALGTEIGDVFPRTESNPPSQHL